MFRIERKMVNIRSDRTVKLRKETSEEHDTDIENPDDESFFTEPDPGVDPEELLEAAKKQAEFIIESARSEAADILMAGKQEAEENSRKAWDDGYLGGVEEGKRSYDEKLLECDESLNRILKELYDERTQTFSNMEEDLVDLSLRIVKKIINPADEAIGVFEPLIRNALRQIAPDDKIMLRVSPADYERYFSEGSAIFELGNDITVSASILKDASLGEFDCIIDMDDSTVNAGLDTQLRHIKLAFDRG